MIVHNVNTDNIRTLLKFDGIDSSDFTDDELGVLINSKIRELEGLIGADINPHDRTDIRKNFTNTLYELSHYPVLDVAHVFLNDEPVCRDNININYDLGVIYFDTNILSEPVHYYPRRFGKGYGKSRGDVLKVQYTTGLSDRDFEFIILPLVKDMIAYTISYGNANDRLNGLAGFVNSLHEGDLSMNFGSNNGSGNSNYGYSIGVNNRIDDLIQRYKHNSRARWL